MRFQGLYPTGAFLLAFLAGLLFQTGRELGAFGRPSASPAPEEWVRLTDPQFGSRFYPFRPGQSLGSLAANEAPRLAGFLDERCRRVPLEAGTEIRLSRNPASGGRDCAVRPLPERFRYLLGKPLNLNRAGAQELELLPGIGPRLASRIVETRETVGPFSSPRDLLLVPGIGKKLVERLEGRVCFHAAVGH